MLLMEGYQMNLFNDHSLFFVHCLGGNHASRSPAEYFRNKPSPRQLIELVPGAIFYLSP